MKLWRIPINIKLYIDNAVFRDKNNALISQKALLLYNKCTVNHCSKRKPPREFLEDNEEINK